MTNISDCIINKQFIHLDKEHFKKITRIKKYIDKLYKQINNLKHNNNNYHHYNKYNMQDMICISLVYSIQWLGPATPHWAINYIITLLMLLFILKKGSLALLIFESLTDYIISMRGFSHSICSNHIFTLLTLFKQICKM